MERSGDARSQSPERVVWLEIRLETSWREQPRLLDRLHKQVDYLREALGPSLEFSTTFDQTLEESGPTGFFFDGRLIADINACPHMVRLVIAKTLAEERAVRELVEEADTDLQRWRLDADCWQDGVIEWAIKHARQE